MRTIWLAWVFCSLFPISNQSQPTNQYLLREKVAQMPTFNLFFLVLGWPWVGEFVGFIIKFICFPTSTEFWCITKHPNIFPELDLYYYTDPAQNLTTVGWYLDDLWMIYLIYLSDVCELVKKHSSCDFDRKYRSSALKGRVKV